MSTLAHSLTALLAVFAFACAGGTGDDTGDDGFTNPGDDQPGDDDPGGGDCEPDVIPAPAGQACAAATRTCMDACADDTCYENCLTADPDAENCSTCLEEGYLACANAAGCQSAWDAVICCYNTCADPEAPECETTCTTQSGAYDTCIEAYDEMCLEQTNTACFMAS